VNISYQFKDGKLTMGATDARDLSKLLNQSTDLARELHPDAIRLEVNVLPGALGDEERQAIKSLREMGFKGDGNDSGLMVQESIRLEEKAFPDVFGNGADQPSPIDAKDKLTLRPGGTEELQVASEEVGGRTQTNIPMQEKAFPEVFENGAKQPGPIDAEDHPTPVRPGGTEEVWVPSIDDSPARGWGGALIARLPISSASIARLQTAITNRMIALGIPREKALGFWPYPPRGGGMADVGSNIAGVGIRVERQVLGAMENWPEWNSASLPARVDAVIAHEWSEFNELAGGAGAEAAHNASVRAGASTGLRISAEARKLLETMPGKPRPVPLPSSED
jgi:hypothetical protein